MHTVTLRVFAVTSSALVCLGLCTSGLFLTRPGSAGDSDSLESQYSRGLELDFKKKYHSQPYTRAGRRVDRDGPLASPFVSLIKVVFIEFIGTEI